MNGTDVLIMVSMLANLWGFYAFMDGRSNAFFGAAHIVLMFMCMALMWDRLTKSGEKSGE